MRRFVMISFCSHRAGVLEGESGPRRHPTGFFLYSLGKEGKKKNRRAASKPQALGSYSRPIEKNKPVGTPLTRLLVLFVEQGDFGPPAFVAA